MIPDPSKLLTETLDLHFDGVKTNRLCRYGSHGSSMNTEERNLFQNMVNDGYELFTKRCADGRGMSVDAIKKIAEGRVWTGEMAKSLNLVDQLGGIDDCHSRSCRSSQIGQLPHHNLSREKPTS